MPTQFWLLVLVATVGCSTAPDNVHLSEADQLSFEVPDNFRVTQDRDAWVLVGEKERAGVTIVLRSVPRDGWGEDRSPETLSPAVETVLRALPGSTVRGPVEIDSAAYPGFAFDLTFQPPSKRGERFRRRHAVLFSAGRVFHVLETWPANRQESGKPDFERVLGSVREEG